MPEQGFEYQSYESPEPFEFTGEYIPAVEEDRYNPPIPYPALRRRGSVSENQQPGIGSRIVGGAARKVIGNKVKGFFAKGAPTSVAPSSLPTIPVTGSAAPVSLGAPSIMVEPGVVTQVAPGVTPMGAAPSGLAEAAAPTQGSGLGALALRGAGVLGGGALGYEGIRQGRPEKGALGGGIAGFALGGPIGGVIGAGIGALGAALNPQNSDLSNRFEGRLNPIARGDYNPANMQELNGLFEKQAVSVQELDPELTQNIRSFREELNTLTTGDPNKAGIVGTGERLLNRYFDNLESGKVKFDSDANQYAQSILRVMDSLDPKSTQSLRSRLGNLLRR